MFYLKCIDGKDYWKGFNSSGKPITVTKKDVAHKYKNKSSALLDRKYIPSSCGKYQAINEND